MTFLNTHQFAGLVNVSDRMAGKALSRCFDGHPYRGCRLIVRRVRGQGGQAGWQYQVRLDSLPAELQTAWQANAVAIRADDPASLEIDDSGDVARWRYEVIEGALRHPSKSPERGIEIERIAKTVCTWPSGRRGRVKAKTIRTWLHRYDIHGIAGLCRRKREDSGRRRVLISRRWDSAVELPEEARQALVAELEEKVRSLWAGLQPVQGWREVQRSATTHLVKLTGSILPSLSPRNLRTLCTIPRNFIERFREYRVVAVHDKDAKAYFDHYLPRISRSTAELHPMQIIMGDVHPIDIYYHREDGSEATPKGIFWMDVATERLWCLPAFFLKGYGVRREHVAESFVRMVRDPGCGCPSSLYLDNGGEYGAFDEISDAMKLVIPVYWGEDGTFIPVSKDPITKAQPYNAPAKGLLEGAFAILEQKYFSKIPGWIGGDRTRKKTANVGKPPAPFPGSQAELYKAILQAVALYNDTPRAGRLGGLSPNEKFRRFAAAGWGPVPFRKGALDGAFCEILSRRIHGGKFRYNNAVYYDDALTNPMVGEWVEIRVPLFGDRDRVMVFDQHRRFVCDAFPETTFAHDDKAGAVESSRRRKVARDHIRAMKRQTHRIDSLAILAEETAAIEPLPIPEPVGAIGFDPETEKAGRELAKSPSQRRNERTEAEDRRMAEWDANMEKLKRVNGCNR